MPAAPSFDRIRNAETGADFEPISDFCPEYAVRGELSIDPRSGVRTNRQVRPPIDPIVAPPLSVPPTSGGGSCTACHGHVWALGGCFSGDCATWVQQQQGETSVRQSAWSDASIALNGARAGEPLMWSKSACERMSAHAPFCKPGATQDFRHLPLKPHTMRGTEFLKFARS